MDRALSLIETDRAEWIEKGQALRIFYDKRRWKIIKDRIISDANRICYICGERIPEDEIATIDHVIPMSRRISPCYKESNLRCCCLRCNGDKGDMDIQEYVDHIENNRYDYEYIPNERIEYLKTIGV